MFENEVSNLNNEQLLQIINCKTVFDAEAILNKKAQIKSLNTMRHMAIQYKLSQKKSESALFAISAANIPIDILAYILTTSLTFAEILLLSIAGLLLCGAALIGAFAYNHLRIDQKRESIIDNLLLNHLKLDACKAFKKNILSNYPNLKETPYTHPIKNMQESLSFRDQLLSKVTRPAVQAVGLGVTAGVALFLSYFFSSTVILASLGVGTVALVAAGGPLFFGVMACCFLLAGVLAYRYYQTLKPWKAIKEETKALEASVSDCRVECAALNIAAKYEEDKKMFLNRNDEAKALPLDANKAESPRLSTSPFSFHATPHSENKENQQNLFAPASLNEDETDTASLLPKAGKRRDSV